MRTRRRRVSIADDLGPRRIWPLGSQDRDGLYPAQCRGPGCEAQPRYRAEYDYLDGRTRRRATRVLLLCEKHARQFCQTNGLRLPERSEEVAP